jgi:hypothetical protein
VRGASHPLAHANACHAVLACDLVDVDTALGGRDCGEDILYVVGLPWQSVARQDSFPCVTGSTACQAHVNVLETGCGLEPALKPAVGQYEVAAATLGAALAVQNRVAAARQGGLILARLDCKYVNHHVPLDGPGEQQLSWFGAVSLFRGRRRYASARHPRGSRFKPCRSPRTRSELRGWVPRPTGKPPPIGVVSPSQRRHIRHADRACESTPRATITRPLLEQSMPPLSGTQDRRGSEGRSAPRQNL